MSGARFRSLVVLSVWKTAKYIRPKLKLAGAQTVRLWAHNAVFHALRTTQLLQMRPRHDVSPAGCGMVDKSKLLLINCEAVIRCRAT